MATTLAGTPRADGFRMPGECEPHAGTWMLWPQRSDNWRLGAKPAQRAWVQVATAVSQFEPVTVGVNNDQYENARNLLPAHVRTLLLSATVGSPMDFLQWLRTTYQRKLELVQSDLRKVPLIGEKIFDLYDKIQEIPNFYPKRDLSKSNIGNYR